MQIKHFTLATIICILVSSCFAEDMQTQDSANNCVDMSLEETQVMVHRQKRQPFKTLLPLSVSEDYLKKKFGKFKVLSEELEDDPYRKSTGRPYKIKSEDWDFTGMILTVKSEYPKPLKTKDIYWIKKILITKNKYPLKLPIKIGNTIDEIQCYLGKIPKSERNNKKINYPTIGGFNDVVDVTFYFDKNHLVEQIEFEYYFD